MTRSRAEVELAEEAKRHCAYVKIVLDPLDKLRQMRSRVLALTKLMPFYYEDYWSPALVRAVAQAISEWSPDVVQAEWIGSVRYLDYPLSHSIPCIYSAHNLEHLIVGGPSSCIRRHVAKPFAWQMARVERYWASRAAIVAAVTEAEAAWFKLSNPRSYSVPNALTVSKYPFKSPLQRQGGPVAFIGHLGYPPNQAAAITLAREIYPRLRRCRPDLHCLIAGLRPNRTILSLAGNGVAVYDNVEDIASIWSQISLLISPLTWGAGSRIKLLEAAAWGVPIIATPISAEGLNLRPDRDYLAAHSSVDMAEKALQLLQDPKEAAAFAHRARQTLLAEHDWSALTPSLLKVYENLDGDRSVIRC